MKKTMTYEISMFGKKFIANVERKTKGFPYVRVILKDENGETIYKWISALSAKEAAMSAICSYHSGMPSDRF